MLLQTPASRSRSSLAPLASNLAVFTLVAAALLASPVASAGDAPSTHRMKSAIAHRNGVDASDVSRVMSRGIDGLKGIESVGVGVIEDDAHNDYAAYVVHAPCEEEPDETCIWGRELHPSWKDELRESTDVWVAGAVDLLADQDVELGLGRADDETFDLGDARWPVLVVVKEEHLRRPTPSATSDDGASSRRGRSRRGRRRRGGDDSYVKRRGHLFLISLRAEDRYDTVFSVRSKKDYSGHGGFSIGTLRVVAERGSDDVPEFELVRQDELPAHRARCKRPDPYAIEYALDTESEDRVRFVETHRPSRGGCD